jgi:hypothetical protein
MSEQFEQVKIYCDTPQKYICVRAHRNDAADCAESPVETVLWGGPVEKPHLSIFERLKAAVAHVGCYERLEVQGGGEIEICTHTARIFIGDYSAAYGPAPLPIVAHTLREAFPDFTVIERM